MAGHPAGYATRIADQLPDTGNASTIACTASTGEEWNVHLVHPTWHASHYSSAVALARLLASPDWKAAALHPTVKATFVTEIRRTVEPGYTWDPGPYWRYIEPLARSLLEGAHQEQGS